MGLSLRQAAELCGVSRSTIHRALKSGKLSGDRTGDGGWSIEPSELSRIFPWNVSEPTKRDSVNRDDVGELIAVQAMQVTMLEQQLAREQETVADLRKRLDRAEERVLTLTAPAPIKRAEEPSQGTLLGRLRHILWG